MAIISPLRGIRYNTDIIKDLAKVITPPYDVIDRDKQQFLYDLSEYNHIRLEYGRENDTDNSEDNRYTRAAITFKNWQEQDVLVADTSPVMYWYEQQFTWEGREYAREGLITTLQVEPFETKTVLPHEETLSGPKEDRLQLMRHCRANFSPIFGLYPDRDNLIDKEITPLKEEPPLMEFSDMDNQMHRVWIIKDSKTLHRLAGIFKPWQIILADGHHRYETALAYSREQARNGNNGFNRALFIMVNLYSPGLLILPTHRIVHNLKSFRADEFRAGLQNANFKVIDHSAADTENLNAFLNSLREEGRGKGTLGMCLGQRLYLLVPEHVSDISERMDADILRYLILEKQLGLSAEDIKQGRVLTYTRRETEALNQVTENKAQMSFFLNPPSLQNVMDTVQQGKRMPQKSTYFYPKMVSGLVINEM